MADVMIGVVGAAGRMGRMLVKEITETEGATLAGATEGPGNPEIGSDAGDLAGVGSLGIALVDDPAELFATADAVIDFTRPAPTLAHAALAAQARTPFITGTTGFAEGEEEGLAKAARHTPIVWAPNMCMGVNLLFAITQQVAAALDDSFDIEIFEIHHKHKVDAPSGTALGLGQAAARGRGVVLDKVAARGRDGITGERKRGDIGFASLRGGSVTGDHTVTFAGEGERIELTHRAEGRHVFARGAVRAALWAQGKGPGLYGMNDVLGL